MALKPITLRLDEEEYEKLKTYLAEFGDPDINVAYVLRAYIRDLNRALPFLMKSGWDLKNYLGLLGTWLKQWGSIADAEMFTKMALNPWSFWNGGSRQAESGGGSRDPAESGDKTNSPQAESGATNGDGTK